MHFFVDFCMSHASLARYTTDPSSQAHAQSDAEFDIDSPTEDEFPRHTTNHVKRYGSGAPYWMSQISRQGKVVYGTNSSYLVWRNVRDFGAKGWLNHSIFTGLSSHKT